MRVFGYVGVSPSCLDVQVQLDALASAGVATTEIVSEVTCATLRETSRSPDLRRLFERVEAGDTVVVWRIDCLGRSMNKVLGAVSALDARAVKLRSLQDGIDPDTADGQLMLNLLVRLAHYDRQLIGERIAAGMDSARQAGAKIGRPPVDPQVTADKLRTVQESRARGLTAAEAAQLVGWSRATFYRHLHAHESQP
ncbi:recombinase family protein [Raineyella sp.]|uniref:recombinase family protein n=1 Tax=Raineyella sp. TaxID=1911550 RepID=UPI002B2167B2|nr:recombinase family protein [Raineyella sp.]MEA5154893.1 recombinase family protein [Raineyella sp.]